MKKIIVFGLMFVSVPVFAMGKKPLLEMKAQLAEQIKLADTMNNKLTGIQTANLKLADKFDGLASAQVGLNNSVSKVSSEMKASSGRDTNINDSQLMKDYIAAIKEGAQQSILLYRFIIGGLIFQLGSCIAILGWCLKFLLKADERRDIRLDKEKDHVA